MMKLINVAYETLKQAYAEDKIESGADINDYGEAFNAALNAIMGLGLEIEVAARGFGSVAILALIKKSLKQRTITGHLKNCAGTSAPKITNRVIAARGRWIKFEKSMAVKLGGKIPTLEELQLKPAVGKI